MTGDSIHDWETWVPLLDALRATAPQGSQETTFRGTVHPRSWGGMTLDDGDSKQRRADRSQAARDIEYDAFRAVSALVGERGCSVVLRASADGKREVTLIEFPDGASSVAGSGTIDEIELVPGAVPGPYSWPPLEHDGVGADPSADPDALRELVRSRLPGAVPATVEEIDAAEARVGFRFPPELRAFYLAAGSGELVLAALGEDGDGVEGAELFYGMQIVALGDEKSRSFLAPHNRMGAWRYGATEVVGADPDQRVQALAASSAWFVVGEDGGGGFYVVDLAPGPNGHVGQVLFIGSRTSSGAEWLAPSLTALLVHRPTRLAPRGATDGLYIGVNRHTGLDLSDVRPHTEVLSIGPRDKLVALSLLAGHSRLRTVEVHPGAASDLGLLNQLPALEYLALGVADWRRLIDIDRVPSTLLAAGISGEPDPDEAIEIANALLTRWGRELVTVSRLHETKAEPPGAADERSGTPAEPSHAAAELSGVAGEPSEATPEPSDTAAERSRTWWSRLRRR